jgi:hypothetical protein
MQGFHVQFFLLRLTGKKTYNQRILNIKQFENRSKSIFTTYQKYLFCKKKESSYLN